MMMSKKTRKIIAITVAVAMLLTLVISGVFIMCSVDANANLTAAEQAELDAARNRANTAQTGIGEVRDVRAINLPEMNRLNNVVAATQSRLSQLRGELAILEAELDEAQRQSNEYEEDFKERLRVMFESGSTTYLQVFFNSDSFSDFARRMSLIREVAEFDEYILGALRELEAQIMEKTLEIAEAEAEVAELLIRQQAEQAEQQAFMRALDADEAALRRVLDDARREEEALIRSIQARLSAEGDGSVFVGTFLWPVPGFAIGSGAGSRFGNRVHPVLGGTRFHSGIDIPAPSGTQVLAANGGTVVSAGWNGGYGNAVVIDHGGGYASLYAHLTSFSVSVGQTVMRGDQIGRVGSTGMSTGPHLHFEILRNGRHIDPMQFF